MTITVYCDGGAEGNGSANSRGYGSYKIGEEPPQRLEFAAGSTNNECEYRTLIAALIDLREEARLFASIYMDSKLVVEQVNERWKVRAPGLKALHAEARRLLERGFHELNWVPRETIVAQLGH